MINIDDINLKEKLGLNILKFTKKHLELKQQDIVTQFFIDGLEKYNR